MSCEKFQDSSIFLQLSRERDVLHGQLDERAIEVQTLRRSVQDATSRAEQSEVQKSRFESFGSCDKFTTYSNTIKKLFSIFYLANVLSTDRLKNYTFRNFFLSFESSKN